MKVMMKKTMIVAAALLVVACTPKTQRFEAADGSVTAVLKEKSGEWKITDAQGNEPVADYDSMRVEEVGEDGHPMTVVYFKGAEQYVRQYYSNMQVRCEGKTVNGLREGRWVFYHANGIVQSECVFSLGREQGDYRVYRENGVPYYIGKFTDGTPSGTWEFYDPEGNLAGTKEY